MKFNTLLEYQKIDFALAKIERELSESDEKKNAAILDSKMKSARDSMVKFNAEADELVASAEKTVSSISAYETEAEEVAKHIGEVADLTEIEYYEKILAGLAEDVRKLEREFIKLANRIDYVKDSSDNLTRQTLDRKSVV